MLAMGAIGAFGHLLLLKAYELAQASVLSPLGYAEMLSAVAVGWIAFGDFPDVLTWVGIAIIVAPASIWPWERRACAGDQRHADRRQRHAAELRERQRLAEHRPGHRRRRRRHQEEQGRHP